MYNQLVFKRDFNLDRVQWSHPIQKLHNDFILEELFHQMTYETGIRPKTAFLAAMDVIRHSPPKMIAVYLRKGGLVAFRSLIERIHGLNRGWETLEWALEIFQCLVSAGKEVRCTLLKHWVSVLRPIKILFERFNHIQGTKRRAIGRTGKVYPDSYRSRARSIIADRRNLPRPDTALFSEYLRTLEGLIRSSPDYDEGELNEVFSANKRLYPLHKNIQETSEALVKVQRNDVLDGLGLDYHTLKPTEPRSTPNQHSMVIRDYFQLENDNDDNSELTTPSSPISESHTSESSVKFGHDFHTMKEVSIESSKSEQQQESPVPKFCDQGDEIYNLKNFHELAEMGPSIVALANRNPVFCPSMRRMMDPSGILEDLAFKIAETESERRKSTQIFPSTEGPKSVRKKSQAGSERPSHRLRVSALASVYGMETSDIKNILTNKAVTPSFFSNQPSTSDIVSKPSTTSSTSNTPSDSSEPIPKLKSRDSLEDMLCCSLNYRRSSVRKSSILSINEVARSTVRKALSVVVEKPLLDIEQEISELCGRFRERHERFCDSVDELAEIIVDRVLLRLKQYLHKESQSRYTESNIKRLISKVLKEEEEDYQRRMSEQTDVTRLPSGYSGRLPVLSLRKRMDSKTEQIDSNTEDRCRACCLPRAHSMDPPRPLRSDSERRLDSKISNQDAPIPVCPIQTCSNEPHTSSRTIEVASVEGKEDSTASSVLPPLKGAQKSLSFLSSESEPSFRSQRGIFNFSESSGEREYTFRHLQPSYELMDSIFTKMAEQLNKQLEELCVEENKKTDDINKQALYVLQRVVSNLAVQMSTSAGRFRKQSSQSTESKARRIVSEVLSNPDIINLTRQSNLSLKRSADSLVENVLRSVYSEVSKSLSQEEESNKNASAQGINAEDNQNNATGKDALIPIVWRPRGMSLHRAMRTGRLLC